jgi:hypothetical protein
MHYMKFLLMKLIYCPKCKEDIMHECGYLLHKKDDNSPMIKVLEVHSCIRCDSVLDSQFHPVEVSYIIIGSENK